MLFEKQTARSRKDFLEVHLLEEANLQIIFFSIVFKICGSGDKYFFKIQEA